MLLGRYRWKHSFLATICFKIKFCFFFEQMLLLRPFTDKHLLQPYSYCHKVWNSFKYSNLIFFCIVTFDTAECWHGMRCGNLLNFKRRSDIKAWTTSKFAKWRKSDAQDSLAATVFYQRIWNVTQNIILKLWTVVDQISNAMREIIRRYILWIHFTFRQ